MIKLDLPQDLFTAMEQQGHDWQALLLKAYLRGREDGKDEGFNEGLDEARRRLAGETPRRPVAAQQKLPFQTVTRAKSDASENARGETDRGDVVNSVRTVLRDHAGTVNPCSAHEIAEFIRCTPSMHGVTDAQVRGSLKALVKQKEAARKERGRFVMGPELRTPTPALAPTEVISRDIHSAGQEVVR
jgi:hypothetical protein